MLLINTVYKLVIKYNNNNNNSCTHLLFNGTINGYFSFYKTIYLIFIKYHIFF